MSDPIIRAGSIKSAIALTIAFAMGMAGALIARNPAIEFHVAALVLFVCAGAVAVFALFAALGAIPRVRMWVHPLAHDFINTQRALYAIALAAAAIAALVSANNLIYLALSCLIAALLASGLTSRLVLAGLELRALFFGGLRRLLKEPILPFDRRHKLALIRRRHPGVDGIERNDRALHLGEGNRRQVHC